MLTTPVLCLLTAVSQVTPYPPTGPGMRVYSQKLQLEFASPAAAQAATVVVAPVYDNREWAFSARWDDCNQNSRNMQAHMAKYGLKGTFYLTADDAKGQFGPDYCQALRAGGNSIGGHTMTHPKLPELKPGAIFWEVLANRVAREADTDTPLNSFAFSFGQYKTPDNPLILQATTEALVRSGYHHSVYADFVKSNPNLSAGQFSTGLQVVPGDKVVEAEKFQASLDKIFRFKDAYAATSRCIHLGVHVWQAGAEWDKLDAVYATLANKPEWWYCSGTEWAAYARQVNCTRVEAQDPAGARRSYSLTRPSPTELGAAVPLTLVIGNAEVRNAKLDGVTVPLEKRGDAYVLNLPHAPAQTLPARIGHIEVPPGTNDLGEALQCADFPGLLGLLTTAATPGKLTLKLQAPPDQDLRDVHVIFRLPLKYEAGTVVQQVGKIAAGKRATVEVPLPAVRPEAWWSEGPEYLAAEVDFGTTKGAGRVFVTTKTE